MDDSGFPRTPDRPVKLLGTRVCYQRSVETLIGACGPDFLGGSTTASALGSTTFSLFVSSLLGFLVTLFMRLYPGIGLPSLHLYTA